MQQSGVPLPPGVAAACAAAVAIPSLQTQFNSTGQVASESSPLAGTTMTSTPDRIASPQSDTPEVDVEVTASPLGHTRSTMLLSPTIDSPNSGRRAGSGTSFSEKQAKLLVSN